MLLFFGIQCEQHQNNLIHLNQNQHQTLIYCIKQNIFHNWEWDGDYRVSLFYRKAFNNCLKNDDNIKDFWIFASTPSAFCSVWQTMKQKTWNSLFFAGRTQSVAHSTFPFVDSHECVWACIKHALFYGLSRRKVSVDENYEWDATDFCSQPADVHSKHFYILVIFLYGLCLGTDKVESCINLLKLTEQFMWLLCGLWSSNQ